MSGRVSEPSLRARGSSRGWSAVVSGDATRRERLTSDDRKQPTEVRRGERVQEPRALVSTSASTASAGGCAVLVREYQANGRRGGRELDHARKE